MAAYECKAEERLGVLIFTIKARHLGDDAKLQSLGEQMLQVVRGHVIDMAVVNVMNVEYAAKEFASILLRLKNELARRGVPLILCSVYGTFKKRFFDEMHLDKVLGAAGLFEDFVRRN